MISYFDITIILLIKFSTGSLHEDVLKGLMNLSSTHINIYIYEVVVGNIREQTCCLYALSYISLLPC